MTARALAAKSKRGMLQFGHSVAAVDDDTDALIVDDYGAASIRPQRRRRG